MVSSDVDLGIDHMSAATVLGRGGFSVVYQATDDRFDRRVAIKVLGELADDELRKFERECRLMGRLSSHPNVVTVFESGTTDHGAPFLVMELIEGGSLADRLDGGSPVPWAEAIQLIMPIASALEAAHDAGVLHRDVKPANILVADGTVKLTDFGISSFRDGSGATSANIAASWLHTPPETFPNRRDARSDVYSLASTLYNLVTGRPPLWRPGEDSLEPLMYRILHEPVPPLPAELAPPALDAVLQRALSKDPDHRPQSAAAFRAELEAVAEGRVPVATVVAAPLAVAPSVSTPAAVAGTPDQPPRRAGWAAAAVLVFLALGAVGAGLVVTLRSDGDGTTAGAEIGDDPDVDPVAEDPGADDGDAEDGLTDDAVDDGDSGAEPTDDTVDDGAVEADSTEDAVDEGESAAEADVIDDEDSGAGAEPTEDTVETAAAPPTFPAGTITPLSPELTELGNFLAANEGEIVELDLDVVLGSPDDFFLDGDRRFMTLFEECQELGPGEAPNALACSGLSLVFTSESAGTSTVGFDRGDNYRIFGLFAVGAVSGPNQGFLSIPLEPVPRGG